MISERGISLAFDDEGMSSHVTNNRYSFSPMEPDFSRLI
jgi:hypothetical protein